QALAPAGGIALSGPLHEQVRYRYPAPYEALGATALKGLAQPIEVYTLAAGALAALPAPVPPPTTAHRRGRVGRGRAVALVLVAAALLAAWFGWPAPEPTDTATPSV